MAVVRVLSHPGAVRPLDSRVPTVDRPLRRNHRFTSVVGMSFIRTTVANGVGEIILDRPKALNALDQSMIDEMYQTLLTWGDDDAIETVLVTSTHPRAFCAGGDISEYPAFRFAPDSLRAFHEEDVWGALSAMLTCNCPLVAAIDGHCMGAGIEIASCCDIRIATIVSRYGAPIGKLGFPMAPRQWVEQIEKKAA